MDCRHVGFFMTGDSSHVQSVALNRRARFNFVSHGTRGLSSGVPDEEDVLE